MKKLVLGLCFTAAALFFTMPVPAAEGEAGTTSSEVQECRKDEDCVYISSGCVTAATNKRYKNRAQGFTRSIDREMDSCKGEVGSGTQQVFCEKPVVECNSEADQRNGKVCYGKVGQCAISP